MSPRALLLTCYRVEVTRYRPYEQSNVAMTCIDTQHKLVLFHIILQGLVSNVSSSHTE